MKRKHKSLSMVEKVELLKKLGKGMSVKSLCEYYGIGSSTVYDLKKQRKILKFFAEHESRNSLIARKTLEGARSSELDSALIKWFKLRRSEGLLSISGEMLMEQARIFHKELNLTYQCEYSQGWLQKFKCRYGISLHKVSGEKRNADTEAAANFVDEFAKIVATEKLLPEQVYNADETALSWYRMPRKTLAQDIEAAPVGGKDCKDRV
ncbi:jerky protein-like [Macrobrachium nipponense]|uniref:jerky protein-like n=1 Tax=Macrobrachium nipponense TaxID=159736 RepID=UPI0030C7BDF8